MCVCVCGVGCVCVGWVCWCGMVGVWGVFVGMVCVVWCGVCVCVWCGVYVCDVVCVCMCVVCVYVRCVCVCALCVRVLLRRVRLRATPYTVACQAPLSMEFSRQEYCSGLPCPPPGNLPDPGIETHLLYLLHWQVVSLPLHHLEICGYL